MNHAFKTDLCQIVGRKSAAPSDLTHPPNDKIFDVTLLKGDTTLYFISLDLILQERYTQAFFICRSLEEMGDTVCLDLSKNVVHAIRDFYI